MTPSRQFVVAQRLPGRLRLRREAAGLQPRAEVEIEGLVLEAQLELQSGEFLLFSTDDCPFEEILHITLLSPSGAVLETLELGAAMQPGLFQNLEALGDGAAEFDFFPEQRHRLEVRDLHRGLLSDIFRRRRLKLSPRDQATTHDEPT